MEYKEFQSLVCESADLYLQYLKTKQSKGYWEVGSKVIPVQRITPGRIPGEYVLYTNERVLRPDECQIQKQGKEIPNIEILKTESLDRTTHAVHIADRRGYFKKLTNPAPGDINIVSDLTFLIRRLQLFYQSNRFSLTGSSPMSIPPLPEKFTEDLSKEQLDAVNTVFQTPVSYISGAPGTGKTKAVLARCILRYALAQKRIFLLAPTNNAVEQMLRGVLPILRNAGIVLPKVYRLGTASEGFAKEYPQVIGDTTTENLLNDLLKQRTHYQKQIENYQQTEKQAQAVLNRIEKCLAVHNDILGLSAQLQAVSDETTQSEKRLVELAIQLNCAKSEYETEEETRDTAATVVSSCEQSIKATQTRINRIKWMFWKSNERQQLEEDLRSLLVNLTQYKDTHNDTVSHCNEAYKRYISISKAHADCLDKHHQSVVQFESLVECIKRLAGADPEYKAVIQESIHDSDYTFGSGTAFLNRLSEQHESIIAKADHDTYQACIAKLELIEKQLSSIGTNSKVLQRENAYILAGTIDSSLVELGKPKHKVYHVFLDEAGYTCLAKGMAAFACGAPVTFLGDHKQLPPVCEMYKISPDCAPVILWALPMAYYTELMAKKSEYLYDRCYGKMDEPSFQRIAYRSLNTSYRFGPGLAKILAQYVYSSKFCGLSSSPFEIQIINAPYVPGDATRTNIAEAKAIRTYLYHNPDNDVAILSPYRNQIKLLRKILPREYRENILTVHRSQGCEWGTVVLSVTDSSGIYYTNSKLPVGRSVINTAISRAKQRLIIVCDVSAWSKRQGQMVTELIEVGSIVDI